MGQHGPFLTTDRTIFFVLGVASLVWCYLSNTASLILCVVCRVIDHNGSPLLEKTPLGQVALERWFPPERLAWKSTLEGFYAPVPHSPPTTKTRSKQARSPWMFVYIVYTSRFVRHPCAGAMLIFSAWFQLFNGWSPKRIPERVCILFTYLFRTARSPERAWGGRGDAARLQLGRSLRLLLLLCLLLLCLLLLLVLWLCYYVIAGVCQAVVGVPFTRQGRRTVDS